MNAALSLGRVLIVTGVILVILGGLVTLARHVPFLGQMPGDISIHRKGVRIFLPLASCLLISLVLTVILNLLFRR